MASLPQRLIVDESALAAFEQAFSQFVTAERRRLTRDKEFLQRLLPVSDLDTLVAANLDTTVQLATQQLQTLLEIP